MRTPRLTGDAAVFDVVDRLNRKFEYPDLDTTGGSFVGGGGGGAPTIVVAAADASDLSKSKADYICTGINDDETLQAASDQLTNGGRLVGTEGTFSLAPDSFVLGADIHLMGMGAFDATIFSVTDDGDILRVTTDCVISDIVFDGQNASAVVGVTGSGSASNVELRSVRFNDMDTAVSVTGDDWRLISCAAAAFNVSEWVSFTAGHSLFRMTGCYAGGTIDFNGGDQIVVTGNILGSTIDLGTTVQDVAIVGNTFWTPGGSVDAILNGASVTGLVFVGNSVFESFGYEAVILSSSSDCVISGNTFDGITAGIALTSCTDVIVANNHLGGDGYLGEYGVILTTSNNCSVTGNVILEPGQDTDDTFDGLTIGGDDNLVTGNKVVPSGQANATRYGINITGGSNNAVFANYLGDSSTYGTADSVDSGTNTIVAASGGVIGGQFAY